MDKICIAKEMRECDRLATENFGIPSVLLMENAAISVVCKIEEKFSLKGLRAAVFCGKGNNGGDGLAIARLLSVKGADVCIYLVSGSDYKGDAYTNYKIAECMDLDIHDGISNYDIGSYDILVDAILGTGISGDVYPDTAEIINNINLNSKYIFSVDIPSGIDSDTGRVCGTAVKADETVTFAAYKRGMFLFPGCEYCGKISVADISMPHELLENINVQLTDSEFIKRVITKRKKNTHKGDYGRIFIIGGSRGLTGAAHLASMGALKSGGGLITLGICESLNGIMEQKLTEIMTLPLEEKDGHISAEAFSKISRLINRCSCVLFGPGLGISRDVQELLKNILRKSKVPVIIDADGINVLARDKSVLDECGCSVILTPHSGEMSRLMGMPVDEVEMNRFEVSMAASQELGATVVLKGPYTIVTGANGLQYINNTGNPGMATGGSGDVLAGMISAFAARGISEEEAAAAAVYLHGLAGDFAKETTGEESLTPTDIVENISKAIQKCM